MKKVVVNTRLLLHNKLEGIGWFTYENLKRITEQQPDIQFYFLFDRPYHPDFIFSSNIIPVVLSPPTRHPILYYWWFEFSVTKFLKEIKPDLFFSPDGFMPLKLDVNSLIAIHDINFEHHPEYLGWWYRNYYRRFFPKFAKKADKIITVSEFSKQDICNTYGIPNEKVVVTYNGVNEKFGAVSPEKQQRVKEIYTDGNPYFVYVGSLNPRKNIYNMLLAFDHYKAETNGKEKFVVVGEKLFWDTKIEKLYNNLSFKNDIVFVGRLPNEKLNEVLASSVAMVYVPFFEGFGIPIIEGFACETPVITSNVTSMPEVAKDAAVLVDPNHPQEIAGAMKKNVENESLRIELVEKGKKRVQAFSWDKSAEKISDLIVEMIKFNKK